MLLPHFAMIAGFLPVNLDQYTAGHMALASQYHSQDPWFKCKAQPRSATLTRFPLVIASYLTSHLPLVEQPSTYGHSKQKGVVWATKCLDVR
jgi:hypothetical protein